MWNPFEKRRLRRDWRLVSTLQAYFVYVDDDGNDTGDKDSIFFYLYENGLGKRKCESGGTGRYSGDAEYMDSRRKSHPYYLGKVRPWVEGQFDPKIPTYETIKAKEFKDELAGKIT